MKQDPIEQMSIKQLLQEGDKQAIIEWFRKKERQESAAIATAPAANPINNSITNNYQNNTPQTSTNTIPNDSVQVDKGNWYTHAKCCCSQLIAQMRITDWLLLAIAILLFFQLIKRK